MPPKIQISRLRDLLNLPDNVAIVDYETDYLTSMFENYGSLMLSLKITTTDQHNKNETLNLVCKLYPSETQWQEMFQIDRTFRKEAGMYTDVIPELIQLQKDLKIPKSEQLDVFIKCHGARLHEDGHVEAAMILDNIKLQGFTTGQRRKGFDDQHVRFIVKKLAQFHATAIALKIKKPAVFYEKVIPFLNTVDLAAALPEEGLRNMKSMIKDYVCEIPEIAKLSDRVEKQVDFCIVEYGKDSYEESIFHSICHNDFWVNNLMIKHDESGSPESVKIFDFQLTRFAPVSLDLIFFLFTSVEMDLLPGCFDEFLRIYYDEFMRVIKLHSCPVVEYSYEA